MGVTAIEQAREALRLAEADPRRSVMLATAVARRAEDSGDGAASAVAERALGLAAVHLEDLDTATRHLRAGIRHGRRAGSPRLAAEARMTLAFVLNRRGRSRQALREIEAALRDLDGVERARAMAQRGAILQLLGRLDEALASYRTALPVLRRAGDQLWTLRVVSNRGVLHGYRHEFSAAEADLHEAEQLSERLDFALWVGFVHQNFGWVNALRGDVPVALHHLDLAERRFRALDAHLGPVLADRGELLLSARLVTEARQAAEQAVEEFERERRQLALPEVRLLLAHAAALDGDPAGALEQARYAMREFTAQRRPEWAELARFTVLASRAAGGQRQNVAVRQVERVADALAAQRWRAAALEARLLAAQLALDRGWTAQACRQLAQASRGRRSGPAVQRARAWYAEALLRQARQNRRGAAVALRAGLRVLDAHRATLGATDLRAHVSRHRTELTSLGLRIAVQGGQPRRVFEWAEQGRASHLLMRPVRPPEDRVLAGALAELRGTVRAIEEARRAGQASTRLVQRQVALERRICDYTRQQHGDAADPIDPVPVSSLAAALGDAALLEFVQLDGLLYAVTVVDGRVRLRPLGPLGPIQDLADHVPFALHRLARRRAGAASTAAALDLLRHAAARFDEVLLGPVADHVGDRSLVLVPTGPLQSLPWSILPSCAGRPVTVSPSAALWYAASQRLASTGGKVAVAAGPGLAGARAEVAAVAAIHRTGALVDSAATVEAVLGALDGATLAHLAAHGRVHPGNPLFSSLRLADGPLTVYDLERLERTPPTVVLAACDSGRTVVRHGDELLGLSSTFLCLGTQQLVASVVPIPDAETAPLMVAFHRLLAAGYPAAEALGRAQQRMAGADPATMAATAGFVCIGAGFAPPAVSVPSPRHSVGTARADSPRGRGGR